MTQSEWRWKSGSDPWIPLSIITWCAIHEDYHGELHEPKSERYANQVMEDLIGEAAETRTTRPVLGLFVHKENQRAIKFYERFRFTSEGMLDYQDKVTKIQYQKMVLILDPSALLGFLHLKKMKRG